MEDLAVPQRDQFILQARLHSQIRDSLNEIVRSFEIHHDTILSQLDASQTTPYSEWWQKLKPQLMHQADLHNQLGKNLITASEDYQATDQNVAQSIQETYTQATH